MHEITRALTAALLHFIWQGTIVGLLLWVALAMLRQQSANVRYAVACVALVVLAALPVVTTAALYADATRLGQPLITPGAAPWAASITNASPAGVWRSIGVTSQPSLWLTRLLDWALPLWSLGVLVCSIRLVIGGAYVMKLRRRAVPADDTTLAIVRRLARRIGVGRQVRVLMSSVVDGPGVIGWLRPMILLPPATLMGLTPEQLEAVLAHELAHIRRHDYAVNVLQMIVETLLFYHPVVWWTSNRMREERELYCDDLAVASCGNPMVYARALTTLERMRLQPPSVVMASTGGSLRTRVHRLLGVGAGQPLQRPRPSLFAAGLVLVSVAVTGGWLRAQTREGSKRPAFEAASIKENRSGPRPPGYMWFARGVRYTATNLTLRSLVEAAYHITVRKGYVTGGPDWIDSVRFDIEAKPPDGIITDRMNEYQRVDTAKLMLQMMLEDRFALRVRREVKQLPVYDLTVSKKGPRLTKAPADRDCLAADMYCHGAQGGPGYGIDGHQLSMQDLSEILTRFTDRVVRDKTGIKGEFDVRTTGWFDPNMRPAGDDGPRRAGEEPIDPAGPSLFTVLEEQLGLRLRPATGPVDTLVIEHAERPTED